MPLLDVPYREVTIEGVSVSCILPNILFIKLSTLQKGQCLVASRDIKPLEIILTDTPAVLGPALGSDLVVCSLCLRVSHPRCHDDVTMLTSL